MAATDSNKEACSRDRAAALTLIAESVVMTLAVTTAEGPWAAPVYYVYRPTDKGFYFFSAPDSRHVSASQQTKCLSATIFRQPEIRQAGAWEQICGLQMRGRLTAAGVIGGTRALTRYMKKFAFTRSLLPEGQESLEAFRHHFGVRLYRFQADWIEWTDNRVHFGYRQRLAL
jgi:uncharacterized protein YhbP (UPF0306 family)